MRMSARVDGVASRVQSAIQMRQVKLRGFFFAVVLTREWMYALIDTL